MSNRHCHRRWTAMVASAAFIGAAACQTSDDPRQGGLISGIAGLSSGGYEKRLEKKRADLEAAELQRAALEDEAEKARREQAAATAERLQSEERLASLDGDIKNLTQRLAEADRAHKLEAAEVDRFQDEVKALQEQRDLLAGNPGLDDERRKHSIETLLNRKRRLEAALVQALGE